MVLLVASLLGACTSAGVAAEDGGVGGDASAQSDAGPGVLDAIAGVWRFSRTPAGGESADLICQVTVGGSAIDVVCPSTEVPRMVGPNCQQQRDDVHVSATIDGQLGGKRDRILEFAGAGCASLGYTVGAPYPSAPDLLLGAVHGEQLDIGLLDPLGGSWTFTASEADGNERVAECDVELTMVLPATVRVVIGCPHTGVEEGGCILHETTTVRADLTHEGLTGELGSTRVYTGAGCPDDQTLVTGTLSVAPVD
jgi:hypothetical protein